MTAPAQPPAAPVESDPAAVAETIAALVLAGGATVVSVKAALGALGFPAKVLGAVWTRRKFGAFVTDMLAKAPEPLTGSAPPPGKSPGAPSSTTTPSSSPATDTPSQSTSTGNGSTTDGATKAPVPATDADQGGGRALVERVAGEEQTRARAGYLAAATNRLGTAYAAGDAGTLRKAWQREDQLLAAHTAAVTHRDTMADLMALDVDGLEPDADGVLLRGWYADENANQCARCAAADGKNFDALKPPPIGWPGWVHPHCFCKPGPPHATTKRVDEVDPNLRASNLKYGKGSDLWKYWTGPKGFARYGGSPHPWEALRDALISEGVPAGQADGLATNIMQATPQGRALFAKGHKGNGKKRSETMSETRAVKITDAITEFRAPSDAAPDTPYGFTARAVNYGVPDTYRTSWKQGVFTEALSERMPSVVWGHDWNDPIGRVVGYRDSSDGLDIDVELDDFDAVPRARQAWAQMKSGTMDQFSFAFLRGEEEADPNHRGVMMQTRAGLNEFSLVLNGSVPGTHTKAFTRSAAPVVDQVTDLFEQHKAGTLDAAHLLAGIRSATAETPAGPAFEFRALGSDTGGSDPLEVLASVDAAMASVGEQLSAEDVQGARRYFSDAASRLSDLLYLLGSTPTVSGYDSWRTAAPVEVRIVTAADDEVRAAQDAELTAALDGLIGRHTRSATRFLR